MTLGSVGGTPFVPGVPVGEVRSVRTSPGTLSRSGRVQPYVDRATTDLVGIVVQPPAHGPARRRAAAAAEADRDADGRAQSMSAPRVVLAAGLVVLAQVVGVTRPRPHPLAAGDA